VLPFHRPWWGKTGVTSAPFTCFLHNRWSETEFGGNLRRIRYSGPLAGRAGDGGAARMGERITWRSEASAWRWVIPAGLGGRAADRVQ